VNTEKSWKSVLRSLIGMHLSLLNMLYLPLSVERIIVEQQFSGAPPVHGLMSASAVVISGGILASSVNYALSLNVQITGWLRSSRMFNVLC
jgi:hypothetical protein